MKVPFDKINRLENAEIVCAIRDGLINLIPVIIAGALSLAFMSFPIDAYQDFLNTRVGQVLVALLTFVFNATYGMLSIYMTISVAYSRSTMQNRGRILGKTMSSLVVFFILIGTLNDGIKTDVLGTSGMFTALFSALLAPAVYEKLAGLFQDVVKKLSASHEEGWELNYALNDVVPVIVMGLIFAGLNRIIYRTTGAAGFNDLFQQIMTGLFEGMPNMGVSGFFFILISSILWCFGIHGSNILQGVNVAYFEPASEANMQAVAAGLAPPHIASKSFMDVFVLMGGCGSTICLLIALLIFSRNKSNRRLAKFSVLPGIFNINEPILFGLSIIYNPILMIPFITVPLLNYLIAYGATAAGLLPIVCRTVQWTTPPLLSGWYATGSLAGTLVQAVSILIGVLIYLPFVKAYERSTNDTLQSEYDKVIKDLKESETSGRGTDDIFSHSGRRGTFLRMLTEELTTALSQKRIEMHYQPQYDDRGRLVGMESLLRWNHTVFGMVYPPLIIKLAERGGFLFEMECYAWDVALAGYADIKKQTGRRTDVSLNTTVGTLLAPRFVETMVSLADKYGLDYDNICIEITEQSELAMSADTQQVLSRLKETGFLLSIDDFSMGFTSVKYLQEDYFNEVKLDGALTRNVLTNHNSQGIIKSIITMANELHFNVIAEYVETEEQRRMLEELGCLRYQGWLFSKAVDKDEIVMKIIRGKVSETPQ